MDGKLGFNLGKLSVKCSYKDGVMENQVRGIQLLGGKSHGYETIAASNQLTLLDIHMSCDEILKCILVVRLVGSFTQESVIYTQKSVA